MTRQGSALTLLAIGSMASVVAYSLTEWRHDTSLPARLAQIVPITKGPEVSCAEIAASGPLVLLALGQSNAGNHGTPSTRVAAPVTLIAEGKCIKAIDPLPGGTGAGGSIWQRLPAILSMQHISRPIVLSILAIDATSIADWTDPSSPLAQRLTAHVTSMHLLGLAPNLILWQQGEADAQSGTSATEYSIGLDRLAATLNSTGTMAPILLAQSTICRSAPSETIRGAIEAKVFSDRRFRLGPNTDKLSNATFRNGCHLTTDGLDSAAKMWAASIIAEISKD